MDQDLPIENCRVDDVATGIDEVRIGTNFGYILLSVVTLGLWVPLDVEWRCIDTPVIGDRGAGQPTRQSEPSIEAMTIDIATLPPIEIFESAISTEVLEIDLIERHIVTLTNREREKRNLPMLAPYSALSVAARRHSENMYRHRFFSHIDHERRSPGMRIAEWFPDVVVGVGENIHRTSCGPSQCPGANNAIAHEIIEGWMNSPGHRMNILNGDYDHLGVGVWVGGGKIYATQNFGTLVGEILNRPNGPVEYGSKAIFRFRYLGSTAKERLFVYVEFADPRSKFYIDDNRYYTGGGPHMPVWLGDEFSITVSADKGRGIYTIRLGFDDTYMQDGIEFVVA